MQSYFHDLVKSLKQESASNEFFAASFLAEDSDFCRFNQGMVRQAGHVAQRSLELRLVRNKKQARSQINLTGFLPEDQSRIQSVFEAGRALLEISPEDPYVLFNDNVHSTAKVEKNTLPNHDQIVTSVMDQASSVDFVGIYAGGGVYRGFANSHGQKNWFESFNYNLDWSIYVRDDKATKSGMSGKTWNPNDFKNRMESLKDQLEVLGHPQKNIKPGNFRVYFSPAAMSEFLGIMAWGCFGLRSQKTKASPLLKLVAGQASVSPEVTILENTGAGASPNFDAFGFTRPDVIPLISNGQHAGSLISASTAKEFGVLPNGAQEWESPNSVEMAGGKLNDSQILKDLGTGIYVNNLWYLNYSDRTNCRITGMTRFATFWVENGQIKAPLGVMRFDDSIYRIFGSNLVGLTANREFMLDPTTYEHRSTGSFHLPGALVSDLALTL